MVRGPQHVLGREWAGGFAHLANGQKKMGFPKETRVIRTVWESTE